jgi:uncharacterized protein YeaO (DUF488 family)
MIREASTSTLRSLTPEQRASYGLCVLTTRRWIQGLSWDCVSLWIPRAAPSKELLSDWQALNKRLVNDKSLVSYRERATEWEKFLACYREEQQALQTTEIVQSKRGTPKSVPMSPVAYLARIGVCPW